MLLNLPAFCKYILSLMQQARGLSVVNRAMFFLHEKHPAPPPPKHTPVDSSFTQVFPKTDNTIGSLLIFFLCIQSYLRISTSAGACISWLMEDRSVGFKLLLPQQHRFKEFSEATHKKAPNSTHSLVPFEEWFLKRQQLKTSKWHSTASFINLTKSFVPQTHKDRYDKNRNRKWQALEGMWRKWTPCALLVSMEKGAAAAPQKN